MNNLYKLNKVGLVSFIIGLVLVVVLSVSLELQYLTEGFIFYLLVATANIGVFVFTAIGFYFWLYFFKLASSRLNPAVFLLYVGCTIISGYWAYTKFKNEINTNKI